MASEEGKSIFFQGVASDRLTRLQEMAPHPEVIREARSGVKG